MVDGRWYRRVKCVLAVVIALAMLARSRPCQRFTAWMTAQQKTRNCAFS